MFFKRAVQQIPLQILLVFFAGTLALLHIVFRGGEGVEAGLISGAFLRHRWMVVAVSFLLLAASSLFFQFFMRRVRIVENRKYYPLMLLPLFLSLFMQDVDAGALFFVMMLCGFFYPMLFSLYDRDSYRQNAGVVAGMMCGCMGLFYAPLLLLLLFYYGLLLAHRLANIRSLLLPLAGLGLWAAYCRLYCFFAEVPVERLAGRLLEQFGGMGFHLPPFGWLRVLAWSVLLLLYVVATYRMIRSLYTKNILIRKKCILLFFLSLFFILLLVLSPEGNPLPMCGFVVTLVMILCEEEAYLRSWFLMNLLLSCCWLLSIIMLL